MRRVVYVTGGSSGIGKELARLFLADGCDLAIFARQRAASAAAELSAYQIYGQQQVIGFEADVTDPKSVGRAFSDAASIMLPDLVINSAGIAIAKTFLDITDEEFARVVNVNLLGSRYVAAAALQHLKPGGQLALIASMAGLMPCYGYSAYGASKYGVVGLAEVLRLEFKSRGIDVSLICPPEVETPLVEQERLSRPFATEAMKRVAGQLSVGLAGQQIYRGIRARRFMIVPGTQSRLILALQKLTPGWLNRRGVDAIVAHARAKAGVKE